MSASCLGGPARELTVPRDLDPASGDAVRDQRVLLQGRVFVDGRDVRSPLYVLDLDRGRVRYIGTAGGDFEDAYTNVPRVRPVSRAAWFDAPVVVPLGNTSPVNRVDPATEIIGRQK